MLLENPAAETLEAFLAEDLGQGADQILVGARSLEVAQSSRKEILVAAGQENLEVRTLEARHIQPEKEAVLRVTLREALGAAEGLVLVAVPG